MLCESFIVSHLKSAVHKRIHKRRNAVPLIGRRWSRPPPAHAQQPCSSAHLQYSAPELSTDPFYKGHYNVHEALSFVDAAMIFYGLLISSILDIHSGSRSAQILSKLLGIQASLTL